MNSGRHRQILMCASTTFMITLCQLSPNLWLKNILLMGCDGPWDTVKLLGKPLFNVWIVAWNGTALSQSPDEWINRWAWRAQKVIGGRGDREDPKSWRNLSYGSEVWVIKRKFTFWCQLSPTKCQTSKKLSILTREKCHIFKYRM